MNTDKFLKDHPHAQDLREQNFGMLKAIKIHTIKNHVYWYFKCDCGVIKSIRSSAVTSGSTKSCGCINNTIDNIRNPRKPKWIRELPTKSLQDRAWRYNLTPEQFLSMLESQDYKCAICSSELESTGRGTGPQMDHDHSCCSGEAGQKTCGDCIRGILCSKCNRGLGCFNDDHELMKKAIEYLIDHLKICL